MGKSNESFLDEIEMFAQKGATKGEPKTTLAEIFELKSLNKIRGVAKNLMIARYTKMEKQEIIGQIETEIMSKEFIENFFMPMECYLFESFMRTHKMRKPNTNKVDCINLYILQDYGVAQLYTENSKMSVVIPKELKKSVSKYIDEDFLTRKARADLINDYVHASINLYGVIKIDEFIEIFNERNSDKIDKAELSKILDIYIETGIGYCIIDDYIASEAFLLEDYANVEDLVAINKGKMRYEPEKEIFLKYADRDYYEETEYTIKLKEYLKDALEEDLAENLAEQLCIRAKLDVKLGDLLVFAIEQGLKLFGEKESEKFTGILVELKNNSRIWANRAHTPVEIRLQSKKITKTIKVGRNEKCPCGSGKKYKKCCGTY